MSTENEILIDDDQISEIAKQSKYVSAYSSNISSLSKF